jgi:hypothetical protein
MPRALALLEVSLAGAVAEVLALGTPLALLEDLLEISPISVCEEVFSFIESHLASWISVRVGCRTGCRASQNGEANTHGPSLAAALCGQAHGFRAHHAAMQLCGQTGGGRRNAWHAPC